MQRIHYVPEKNKKKQKWVFASLKIQENTRTTPQFRKIIFRDFINAEEKKKKKKGAGFIMGKRKQGKQSS